MIPDVRWYCVRTLAKSEHLAADRLKRMDGVEPYCPRIRFRRATRRGAVWFTEALFPGYVFARFDLALSLRSVIYTAGVRGVVRFGDEVTEMPESALQALRAELGDADVRVFDPELNPGDHAMIIDGPLKGLEAVVRQVLPARERVRILLTFLGQPMETDIPKSALANLDATPFHVRPAAAKE